MGKPGTFSQIFTWCHGEELVMPCCLGILLLWLISIYFSFGSFCSSALGFSQSKSWKGAGSGEYRIVGKPPINPSGGQPKHGFWAANCTTSSLQLWDAFSCDHLGNTLSAMLSTFKVHTAFWIHTQAHVTRNCVWWLSDLSRLHDFASLCMDPRQKGLAWMVLKSPAEKLC